MKRYKISINQQQALTQIYAIHTCSGISVQNLQIGHNTGAHLSAPLVPVARDSRHKINLVAISHRKVARIKLLSCIYHTLKAEINLCTLTLLPVCVDASALERRTRTRADDDDDDDKRRQQRTMCVCHYCVLKASPKRTRLVVSNQYQLEYAQ